MTKKEIYFDLDGTLVDLYGVENWLSYLNSLDETPYTIAKPLLNMQVLARQLNRLQKLGYTLNIISWCSKHSTKDYDERIKKAKLDWLKKHLNSVKWNKIDITEYGTYKEKVANNSEGILFDDEPNNRLYWSGTAYDEKEILTVLKNLE